MTRSFLPALPTPVKKLFDKFPLVTLPAAELPDGSVSFSSSSLPPVSSNAEKKSLKLFVYNFEEIAYLKQESNINDSEDKNISTIDESIVLDPEGLIVQCILKQHKLKQVKLYKISQYGATDGKLPLLIDEEVTKQGQYNRHVYSTLKGIVNNIFVASNEFKIYSSLIENSLQDAWSLSLLDPRNRVPRDELFLSKSEGFDKIPLLKDILSNSHLNNLSLAFIQKYPFIGEKLFSSNQYYNLIISYLSQQPSNQSNFDKNELTNEIFQKAENCLVAFEGLLSASEGNFLNLDDGSGIPKGEMNSIDIALFSYVYVIMNTLENCPLKTIVKKFPHILEHCDCVYSELF